MGDDLPGVGLVHAGSVLTGGACGLCGARVDAGWGPPGHVHREREEGFCVRVGEFSVWCGGAGRRVWPGSFAVVPGGAGQLLGAGGDGARLLVVVSPAGLEGFFRERAWLAGGGVREPQARRRPSDRDGSRPLRGGCARAGAGGPA